MSGVLIFCGVYLIWFILAVPAWLGLRGEYRLAAFSLANLLLVWGADVLIKSLFYLPRPFILNGRQPLLGLPLDGSFPSGHTAVAAAVAFSIFPFHRRLSLFLILLTLGVASARVAGRVHTPADILGGLILALVVVLIVYSNFRS